MQQYTKCNSGLRTFLVRFAIFLGTALVIIDSTIVTVGLPVMAAALHITDTMSIWIMNSYQVVLLAFLFPATSMARRLGRVRLFQAGVLFFTIASLGCALSWNFTTLIIFRILQALGGAAIMSVNLSLVQSVFPGKELGRGIAINSAVISLSIIVAPAMAGFVLMLASWPWLFAINIPLGALTLFMGRGLSRVGGLSSPGASIHSASALLLNLVLFTSAFTGLAVFCYGFPAWSLPVSALVFLGTLRLFRNNQRDSALPVYPVRLLARKGFGLTMACIILCFMAQSGTVLALPFLLTRKLGFDIASVSLLLICWPSAHIIASLFCANMRNKINPHICCLSGICLCFAGIISIVLCTSEANFRDMALHIAVCGLGYGFFQAPNDTVSMTAAPEDLHQDASAMLAFSRILGQTLGSMVTAAAFLWIPDFFRLPFIFTATLALAGAVCIWCRWHTAHSRS